MILTFSILIAFEIWPFGGGTPIFEEASAWPSGKGSRLRIAGSNPAGGKILPERKRRFIAQSLSCSPFRCLEMTEILLKGPKTLTHPSCLWSHYFLEISSVLTQNTQVVSHCFTRSSSGHVASQYGDHVIGPGSVRSKKFVLRQMICCLTNNLSFNKLTMICRSTQRTN